MPFILLHCQAIGESSEYFLINSNIILLDCYFPDLKLMCILFLGNNENRIKNNCLIFLIDKFIFKNPSFKNLLNKLLYFF